MTHLSGNFSFFFTTSASTSVEGGSFPVLPLCWLFRTSEEDESSFHLLQAHGNSLKFMKFGERSLCFSLLSPFHACYFVCIFLFSGNTQECCMWSRTNFKVKSCCFFWTAALPVSMAINAAVGSLNLKFLSWINISRMSRMRTKKNRQWGEFKLFAISKFLRATHSAVKRLIAFSLGRRWKIHFSIGKNAETESGAVSKCFAL